MTENLDGKLLKWLRFLASKTKEEMEVEAKKDSEIMEAYECLQDISKDDRNRMEYEARGMWLMDHDYQGNWVPRGTEKDCPEYALGT